MTEVEEKFEVGDGLVFKDRFEVEFDIGGTGEAVVVSQEVKLEAIGEHAPAVPGGAVEKFLYEAVGAACVGACGARLAAVEVKSGRDQMDGHVIAPDVTDGIGLVVNLDRILGLKSTEAEFAKEREQEAVAGEGGGSVGKWKLGEFRLEPVPGRGADIPGPGGGIRESVAGIKVIVFRCKAGNGG